MRHLKAGKKLGRNATHRLALYRNLAKSLIQHERIITTLQKAKAVRPFVEKLITLAKKGTLHARRLARARLGPAADAEVKPGDDANADHRTVLAKLFSDLQERYQDRPGGYTRILKRSQVRLGDAGRTAFLELLKAGEQKKVKPAKPTAPRVEEEKEKEEEEEQAPPQETPAAEGQPQSSATPPAPPAEQK